MARTSRYAAFLRGMNLGGRRITNEQLRSSFAALGFREVDCFRASGNVVFVGPARSRDALAALVEEGLAASLGYAVPTFIRTDEEVRAIAERRPFAVEHVQASEGKLHVALLAEAPSPKAREQVLALASDRDRLAFGEDELYWLPSGRMIDSGLDLKSVERLLGAMTLRTKNTIELMVRKHLGGG